MWTYFCKTSLKNWLCFYHWYMNKVLSRILKSTAEYVMKLLCFWFLLIFLFSFFFFSFRSTSFDILVSLSISCFLSVFQTNEILLLRHSQNNYQIWLYTLNLMSEKTFLSNYRYLSCQSSSRLLLEVCKNHYKH